MILQDTNMLVEAVPFSSIGRVQPFLISVVSSVTLMIDFHCHLTTSEVCGYLGGTWDFNTHTLSITHSFPLLNSKFDREKTSDVEYEIQKAMLDKNIQLVGWYHSHPRFSTQPTLRDCDKQMDYQIKLRGTTDATYTPCVGFIFGSYEDDDIENEGMILPFWVLPPPENRPHELGRPMLMAYSLHHDESISDDIKVQMEACVNYYKQFQYELIDFNEMKLKEDVMVLEKMKNSMFQRFPLEEQVTGEFWNWIRELLGLNREEPVVIPRRIIEQQKRLEEEARLQEEAAKEKLLKEQEERKLKEEREQEAAKQALNAMSSLQQQLNQPSGLNMTPSPISSAIITLPATGNHKQQSTSSNATNTSSSPRDSPATIPSTATSPAKFEVPVRASPSPAKSDTSSIRARNSPAPSPAKLPERPPRNSSSVSSNSSKYDLGYSSNNLSDLYAATLASLAKNLPPGLLPADYQSLLQGSKMPDFGMSALGSLQASAAALSASSNYSPAAGSGSSGGSGKKNQSNYSNNSKSSNASTSQSASAAAAAAAAASAANTNSWLSQIPNMKEFMNQLEKGDLSVLMQSPYNIPTCKPTSNKNSSGSSSARTDYHHQDNVRETSGAGKRKGRPPNPNAASAFDYDGYKSEVGKIADLMKSPEYTQMLMNQANAFRGLGSEITVTRKPSTSSNASSSSSSSNKKASAAATAAAMNQNYSQGSGNSAGSSKNSLLNQLPVMDLNYLAEISKQIPELNALLNSNKPEDINALLQMQMMSKNMDYASALFGGGGSPGGGNQGGSSKGSNSSSSAATAKAMQDYAAASSNMLSQYMSGTSNLSSLFGPMYGAMSGGSLTSLEKPNARESNSGNSRKRDNSNRNSGGSSANKDRAGNMSAASNAADMLNSLFTSATKGSSSGAASNLMHPDLSSYFSSPAASPGMGSSSSKINHSTSGGGITSAMDYSSLFSHMTPSKLQEMTSLFSQSKYPGIPDPLAKSTLAANNAYLSPSLMKLQQEALNTRLMKPPKSSSSSSSSKIETPPLMGMSSPLSDKRSTPTKSHRDSPASLPKYNFSAADLAISSHVPSASSTPTDFSRKSTPPVDLAMKERSVPPKKRMEFSSIAELVAPSPTKRQKYADEDNDDEPAVLNLSNN